MLTLPLSVPHHAGMGLWGALALALGVGMLLAWLLVGLARTVATAARAHRHQVFTNLKETDSDPRRESYRC